MSDPTEQSHLSEEALENFSREMELSKMLATFYALNLADCDEAYLLELLKNIFIDITCMEKQHDCQHLETLIPWITFWAKEERFYKILKRLVSEEQLRSKFPKVVEYIGEILSDEIVPAMEHAGFPLEEMNDSTSAELDENTTQPNPFNGGMDKMMMKIDWISYHKVN